MRMQGATEETIYDAKAKPRRAGFSIDEVKQRTASLSLVRSDGRWWRTVGRASSLLLILALYSRVSQLALSPVYGSIPSSLWHEYILYFSIATGWLCEDILPRQRRWQTAEFNPVLAFYIPSLQSFLFGYSSCLGAIWGPVITETLTLCPLVILCSASIRRLLKHVDFFGQIGGAVCTSAVVKIIDGFASPLVDGYIGSTRFSTRMGYQFVLSFASSLLAPSPLLVWTLPAILHMSLYNVHVPRQGGLAAINTKLLSEGYRVLARAESRTGYISVIENLRDHYTVMRCDHSLLGGLWSHYNSNSIVHEPIYAIFAMLEAVRLIERPAGPLPDSDAQGLVIGLGIGTTPGALIAHGINTTIVEIDPIVYEFAVDYFQLPLNHTSVIADAVVYVEESVARHQKYDYIIHDVFTGGAEPAELFTVEFLANLRSLLNKDGVIAINYATDLLQPSTHVIVNTILSVFPSCRIFRETPRPMDEELAKAKQDFTNMVLFCQASNHAVISFRQPVDGDYLESGARQAYLMPSHEIDAREFSQDGEVQLLTRSTIPRLKESQMKSAVGHWNVMRTVIPPSVWELW